MELQPKYNNQSIGTSSAWFIKDNESKNHKKNKLGPCRRWGHSSVIFDNKMYIYGGAGNSTKNKFWENAYQLELETWEWSKLSASGQIPAPGDSHSCTIVGKSMYVFGGSNGNDSLNDLYEFDMITNIWKKIQGNGNIPTPREGHSACVLENRYIVIYGGWNGESTFHDCFLYDTVNSNWINAERRTIIEPASRESQSCCSIKDYMYVFGGQGMSILINNRNYENFFNDLHRFKVVFEDGKAFVEWESIEPKGKKPTKRASHSSCSYKNRYMFIIGGEGYPSDINEESLLEQDSKLPILSEENYPCYPKNDVWYYDVEINEWFQMQITNGEAFIPRFAHSCNIYEDYLIVFGGLSDYAHSMKDICILSFTGKNPFETTNLIPVRKKSLKLIHETRILCQDCKHKNPYPSKSKTKDSGNMYEEEKKALRYMKDQGNFKISIAFLNALSQLISWPFACFGLLTDNSILTMAKKININYLYKTKSFARYCMATEEIKNFYREKMPDDNEEVPFIIIQDNGIGWNTQEFLDILYIYDEDNTQRNIPNIKIEADKSNEISDSDRNFKLKRYAINLKLSGLRLGKILIYLTKHEDTISLALITSNPKYNPDIHGNNVFYTSWNIKTGEYKTMNGQVNKYIIFNALALYFKEQEILNMLKDDISNVLIILDLNTLTRNNITHQNNNNNNTNINNTTNEKLANGGSNGNNKNYDYELFLKKSKDNPNISDLIYRTIDKNICKIALRNDHTKNMIDLSLKAYLHYLYLDPSKYNISIFFNDQEINLVNWKNLYQINPKKIIMEEGEIYQGIIIKNSSLLAASKSSNNNGISDTLSKGGLSLHNKDNMVFNQGILLYHDNRLIRRIESIKFGSLEYLIANHRVQYSDIHNMEIFDYSGYIEINTNIFKPNLIKTEIENPYYSNLLYYSLGNKINDLENNMILGQQQQQSNPKRKNESNDQNEGDILIKKIKQE